MKYKDEFHIASTAILLCAAMLGISAVVPKESRVPTAQTTLQEAPETAAEAAAEQQAEFPIYTQESNYDTSDDSGQDINYYDDSQSDTSYDTSGSDYEDAAGNTDGSDNTGSSDSALVIPATTEVILVIPLILPEVARSLTLPMTPRTTARIFQTTPRMLPLTMDRKTALYGRTPPPEARITEEIHLAKILSIMNDM